jgi:hypothetical protein
MATFKYGYIHTPIFSQVQSGNQCLVTSTNNDRIKGFISHPFFLLWDYFIRYQLLKVVGVSHVFSVFQAKKEKFEDRSLQDQFDED